MLGNNQLRFSEMLSVRDRNRLRSIVKRVHMRYFPAELVSNAEADRMIDVIAPETAEYLIRKHWEAVK